MHKICNNYLQVQIRRTQDTVPTVEVGATALLTIEETHRDFPRIGTVERVEGQHVSIHRYRGNTTTTWEPCFTSFTHGHKEKFIQIVTMDEIWKLFNMTEGNRLPRWVRQLISDRLYEFK